MLQIERWYIPQTMLLACDTVGMTYSFHSQSPSSRPEVRRPTAYHFPTAVWSTVVVQGAALLSIPVKLFLHCFALT